MEQKYGPTNALDAARLEAEMWGEARLSDYPEFADYPDSDGYDLPTGDKEDFHAD